MGEMERVVVAVTSLCVAFTGLVAAVVQMWRKLSRNDSRLERLWRGHLLRGKVEAIGKGLAVETFGDVSSISPDWEGGFMPLAVRSNIAKLFEPAAERLKALWAKNPGATDEELADLIEIGFSGWMARNICLVLGVNQYACIAMAISVAKGVPPVPDSTHD